MPHTWHTWPLELSPIIGHVGDFPVTWYALLYIFGVLFAGVYFVVLARRQGLISSADTAIEVMLSILWGVLIGARLGFVVLYGGAEFIEEPWRIFMPYDVTTGMWVGIRGMSFHGGVVGAAIGLWMFTREAGRKFFQFSDILVQAAPIGLFCGRIGNFLNQEILGRASDMPWALYFPGSGSARLHPVTLYEAFFEGIVLFMLLRLFGRRAWPAGHMTAAFLLLYAGIRYIAEQYRALPQSASLVFGVFSIGQALSIVMVCGGVIILLLSRRRMVY